VIGNHVARRAQLLQAVVWSLLLGAGSLVLYEKTRWGRDAFLWRGVLAHDHGLLQVTAASVRSCVAPAASRA
jgi:hypothetical protein